MADPPPNWTWRAGPVAPGPAAVFDVDGVLSDAAGRQHFLDDPRRRDWRGFFDAAGDDPLLEDVHTLLDLLRPDLTIVLLTARPYRVRPQTLGWLERYAVRWDLLIMRADGDGTPAVTFKEQTVEELRAMGFELRIAFEDDRRNVDMLRAAGVPCVYIHSGYYE